MGESRATWLALACSLAIPGCGGGGHAAPDARPSEESGTDASPPSDGDKRGVGDAGDHAEASDAREVGEMSDVVDSGDSSEAGDGDGAVESGPPSVSQNPPVPTGWKLMSQSKVTPQMNDWAVMILHDSITYPMFSTTMTTFGALTVLARVEWRPPDFQTSFVHRGVVLYEPI